MADICADFDSALIRDIILLAGMESVAACTRVCRKFRQIIHENSIIMCGRATTFQHALRDFTTDMRIMFWRGDTVERFELELSFCRGRVNVYLTVGKNDRRRRHYRRVDGEDNVYRYYLDLSDDFYNTPRPKVGPVYTDDVYFFSTRWPDPERLADLYRDAFEIQCNHRCSAAVNTEYFW